MIAAIIEGIRHPVYKQSRSAISRVCFARAKKRGSFLGAVLSPLLQYPQSQR
jgi:hypothetical protein